MIRKYIEPGTRLPVKLTTRERDLVVERAFLDPEIEAELRQAAPVGSKLLIKLNLDDIDDLLGCVSAESNHCGDDKVQRVLDALGDRLAALLDRFSDEPAPTPAVPLAPKARFTAKQGQYPAFIHYYTKVHRTPPAEADLQRYLLNYRTCADAGHCAVYPPLAADGGRCDAEPPRLKRHLARREPDDVQFVRAGALSLFRNRNPHVC